VGCSGLNSKSSQYLKANQGEEEVAEEKEAKAGEKDEK
jgi:hypothetical protein